MNVGGIRAENLAEKMQIHRQVKIGKTREKIEEKVKFRLMKLYFDSLNKAKSMLSIFLNNFHHVSKNVSFGTGLPFENAFHIFYDPSNTIPSKINLGYISLGDRRNEPIISKDH